MPISFHRPLRLLHRQPVQPTTPAGSGNNNNTNSSSNNNNNDTGAPIPSGFPPSSVPTPSAARKSPPRRSRARCLPCVGPPAHTPAAPSTPPPLRRAGFEHVDAAVFPPLPQPVSSRCPCELDHLRIPTLPDDIHHPSTPHHTPLQPTANRPPTPSAHAFAGLLPAVADTPGHQLPHTPLPSPSNRPLHVHAANLVSQLPENVAAGSPSRTASYQPPPNGVGPAAGRRRHNDFVRRSQDTAFAAAGSRSVQLHDFNSNMMVLVTLGDSVEVSTGVAGSMQSGLPQQTENTASSSSSGSRTVSSSGTPTGTGSASGGSGGSGGSSPAQSVSDHAASSQDEGSGGEVGLPEMVIGSEEGSQEGDGSDNLSPSDVTDEDTKEALEKKLAEGSPTEIIKRALSEIRASEELSHRELSDGAYDVVMRALERVLAQGAARSDCLSDVHPDDRTEVHYRLAKYHRTMFSEWPDPHCESVLHHCREGLFLMHGRERLFPTMAAELHALASEVLLLPRDPKQVQKFLPLVVKHLSDARVVMYAYKEADQELAYRISLFTAAAHVLSTDEPTCDNLLRAYTAYKNAEDMLRMGDFNTGPDWMRLGCHQLQVMLRFLRHKRRASLGKGSLCSRTESAACRREPNSVDDTSDMTPDAVVTRAEAMRLKITRHFEVNPDELEGEAERRQLICATHESVARSYLERAAVGEEKRMYDLKKAAFNIDKAMGTCAWNDDYAGQKYSSLRELADDVQRDIREMKCRVPALTEEDSDDSGNVSPGTETESGAGGLM